MRAFIRIVASWIPLGIAITGLCFLAYATVQQNYRQSLNDPQIQMAEDAARFLAQEYTPAAVVPRGTMVDIADSLSTWIAVYDESGVVLESSGVLDDKPPLPPQGVFEVARSGSGKGTTVNGQNRVSWMPREDVRSAIVIQHIDSSRGGFVVVGRSMREVENREAQLSFMILITWLAILAATLVAQAATRVHKNQ